MKNDMIIRGAKKGQQQPRKPIIGKDTASSTGVAKIVYGLANGVLADEILPPENIFLDGTPLVDSNGNENFPGVTYDYRNGTNEQTYMPGFPDIVSEVSIGVELKSSAPFIKAINNTQLSAVRVRLEWQGLSKTNSENGDVTGHTIDYAIDLQTDGGVYQEVINTRISDKVSAGYKKSFRIDLPRANSGWQIRIRRITPNANSDLIRDTMIVDAIAEIIDVKMSYPNTAVLGIQYDFEMFSNVPKLEVFCRGTLVRVPTNYNAVTRTYSGIWDGTFKEAYTQNPAWLFYDLCLSDLYGIGERINQNMVDKWSIYTMAQFCDQRVSNGQGGTEPRFSANFYLQTAEHAYEVLRNLGGVFRAMSYWNGEKIVLDADMPKDPVYTFSRANTVSEDGDDPFEYSSSAFRDRHTLIKVAWDNPENDFKTEFEYMRDEKAIAVLGVRVLELAGFACTSRSQAQRMGLIALLSEQLETRQVSFRAGLDGSNLQVGDIVNISDELFAGRANGGRIGAVSANQTVITLDRDVFVQPGDTLIINNGLGKNERRRIRSFTKNRITVMSPFEYAETENVWALENEDLKLMRFRLMSISENEDATYNFTGVQHEPKKYNVTDFTIDVKPTDISVIPDNSILPPEAVTITSRHRIEQAQTIATMVISWTQVENAIGYIVEWRKDNGNWITLPKTGGLSLEVDGVYSGIYTARVRAISFMDVQSQPKTSAITDIKGKVGLPPPIVGLAVEGQLFGFGLSWSFGAGSNDAAYTEIEVGNKPEGGGEVPSTTVRNSLNLYDPSKVTTGKAVGTTGAIVDSSYSLSDFIPVQAGFRYVYTSSVRGRDAFISTAYYDASKNFITRVNTLNRDAPYYTAPLIPANVAYVRLNISSNPTAEDRMFALGTTPKPYEPFGRITVNTAKTGDANVSVLGQFAYSTNSAEITGLQGGLTQAFRARLVDKSGFKSEWSHWVKGTTEDTVAVMLDVLNDKLTSSQLDIDLRTKVNKIEGIEDGINQEIIDRKSEDSRVVGIINTTASTWNNNLAVVQDEVTAITSPTGAIATSINTLQTKVDKTTALRHYKLGGSKAEWRDYDGQAELFSGSTLVIGNEEGNDQARLVHQDNIPLLDGVVYKITARIRNLTAGNRLLFGVAGVSVSGQSFVNVFGSNSLDSQFYLADYTTADADYRIITGYISSSTTDIPDTANRKRLHASAKFFRPLLFANYPNKAGKVYADFIKIETVDAELMSSVQETKESINGAYAKWSMKLDVNGYVGGLTGGNDGREVDFILRTDAFTLAPPSGNGNNINSPFTFRTTTANINGTIFPIGAYLKAAFIDALSVDTGHIKNLAVKSAQIDNLAVTKGKIADLSVDTLKIAGDAVTVARNQYTEAAVEFNMGSGEVTINEQTINAEGGNVTIQFAFERLVATPSGELTLRVKRNGTTIKTLTFEVQRYANGVERRDYQVGDDDRVSFVQVYSNQLKYAFGCIPAFNDIQPAGNVTYSVTIQQESSGSAIIKSRSLLLMGSKK